MVQLQNRNKTTFSHTAVICLHVIAVLFFPVGAKAETDGLEEALEQHVIKLSGVKPARNFKNPASLDSVAFYIETQLVESGYQVQRQYYEVQKKKYCNLICVFGDTSLPRMVIGAHYDVCGDQPGADDNASGVAGLLELARKLKKAATPLTYCVEMVFYTLEEPPFFRTDFMGSYIHAKSLAESKKQVLFMISLEMIGYFDDAKNTQQYPVRLMKLFYPSRGNFIALVAKKGNQHEVKRLKKLFAKQKLIPVEKLIAPAKIQGVDFSDHLNYWRFGFKALMITDSAFLRNNNYHRSGDVPVTLNYHKMAAVVESLLEAVLHYA